MWETLVQALEQDWAIRALIASSLVGIMCGALGAFIVLRNMALIGDALAHAILPGVVLAFIIVGYTTLGFFTGAVLAGLLTAAGITWIQQNVGTKNDAAIGIVFTAMFSIGVVGISWISKEEGVHLDLKDFLFGNVLGVYNQDLVLTAAITLYVILSLIVFYRYLFVSTFQSVVAETMGISVNMVHYFLMLLLSFAVVASLQTVGVIQVVAMLITPSSTALLLSNRLRTCVILSGFLGLFAAVVGLILAIMFSTTPGPMMAIVATAVYLLAVMFAPEKGMIFRYFANRNQARKIQLEDIIKQTWNLSQIGTVTLKNLGEKLGMEQRKLESHLRGLSKRNLISLESSILQLTEQGTQEAERLVRAHRLWETYLVEKVGLSEEQIHEEAEKYEHLMSEDMISKVDKALGFPSKDPHGSPIPLKAGAPIHPLIDMQIGQSARIDDLQIDKNIQAELWKLGILPDQIFVLKDITTSKLRLLIGNQEIELPKRMAARISVEKLKT
ncbi:MAG: iron chelate uptake ABC transporter family permease subunit [Saprospiraceae bacterium]|nr:iron chelate uptake ABC transporter family permease subunit [Saprospiraceae bacterium]